MLKMLSWPNLAFGLPLFLVGAHLIRMALFRHKVSRNIRPSHENRYEGASLDRSPEAMGVYTGGSYVGDFDKVDSPEESQLNSLQGILDFVSKGRLTAHQTLLIVCAIWGMTGLTLNFVFDKIFTDPLVYLWLSALLAFLISITTTRLIAYLTAQSNLVKRNRGLIGCEGRAMDRVTLESGMAQIFDQRGALHRVFCRIEPDGNVIQEGDDILVVGYDSEEGRYLVKRSPD